MANPSQTIYVEPEEQATINMAGEEVSSEDLSALQEQIGTLTAQMTELVAMVSNLQDTMKFMRGEMSKMDYRISTARPDNSTPPEEDGIICQSGGDTMATGDTVSVYCCRPNGTTYWSPVKQRYQGVYRIGDTMVGDYMRAHG
jgi:uncharacterized coiled-coil protein SlyX